MKNFLRDGLAKKAILFAFIIGLVSPSAMAYVDGGYPAGTSPVGSGGVAAVAPSVQNMNVTTAPGSATVSFNLNTNAYATVWIKDPTDTVVKTLAFDNNLSGGTTYSWTWNGTNNNGAAMAAGAYKAQVVAYNSVSSDIENFNFNYTTSGSTVTAPVVNVSASPLSFDPTLGQSTTVSYTLNTSASLKVEVKLNGSVIRTLRPQSSQSAGSYTLIWDGRNDSGTIMSVNAYDIEVYASNSAGNDLESVRVNIISSTPSVTAPNVTNLYASPTPFNPSNENTRVYFTLDKNATVTVDIMDGSSTIRNLVSGVTLSAGTYFYEWNGRNSSGNTVSDKVYTARVTASNSAGSDTETTSVEVKTSGTGTSCDLITSHFVNPSTFNPADRDAQINYVLSRTAEVTVRIKDGSTTIRTIVNNQTQTSGQKIVSWNGRNSDGNTVSTGNYTYEIRAYVSGCAEDVEYSTVRVSRDSEDGDYENDLPSTDEDLIKNLMVRKEVFNPIKGERSTVEFDLTRRADLKVEVLDGTKVVKVLRDVNNQSSGFYSYNWDGRDTNGNRVKDNIYVFRVMADDGSDTDTDRAYVEVDTDGIIIGFPDSARCAGFRDVSVNSPFCKAIELMSKKRIFEGYSDGTFRPYEKINRAETAKVVVLALDYDVDTNAYFGKQYKDTIANAWYAPYLEVARRNNIATGYPDGTFRPASTINRVELLRVFLEANRLSLSSCSPQPFEDTPINKDTDWYMKYACYAKHNGLMNSEYSNKLYPADAMTRGDVADLFYDFEVKGLYSRYDRYGYNSNRNCVEYDRYGDCMRYEYDYNYGSGSQNRYCVEYDSYNGQCRRYEYAYSGDVVCTRRNSSGTCLEYSVDRYTSSYNTDNGYYVYRDGKYVWISY